MNSLFFWKDWHKEYRYLFFVLAAIFVVSAMWLWFSYFRGNDNVIHWQRLQQQKEIETAVHTFRLGPFELEVPGDTYVIYEYLHGSPVSPNTFASYAFLALLCFSAIVIVTVVTTLERLWFYVGVALFTVFMVYLRFETVGLFGTFSKIPAIAIIAVYVLSIFLFSKIRPSTAFLTRLSFFILLSLVVALLIAFFSSVNFPFYQLTITGYVPALIISLFFVLMVAHEIVRGFLFISSQGRTKNLNHLLIISVFYLVSIVLTALHESDVIDWNLIYLDVFLLLTLSSIIGLWGFQHREELYLNIFPFYPIGAFLYLALGTICFVTIGQLLGNANDPGVKIFRDIIIFSHVGFGIVFLMYLFSNYSPMLAKNMPVYPVLYRPTRMPYFTFRLAGLIVTLAFVFNNNIRDYVYKGFAAYYNSGADLFILEGNIEYAETFYDRARLQSFGNHRANYALGTLRTSDMEFENARDNYSSANYLRPSEYSLTNAGNLYAWQSKYQLAVREYEKGLKVMNNSGPIANDLALAFINLHQPDSAFRYLEVARRKELTREAAETNFFAMAAQEKIPVKIDSILDLFSSKAKPTLANALALSTITNHPMTTSIDPLATRDLDLYSATFLNNYIIRNAKGLDTTFIEKAYALASDSLNAGFSEALKASIAFAYYHQGNVSRALSVLAEQVYHSQSYQGKFNYIMGLWALEQKNPELAEKYFSYADRFEFPDAPFYRAIAITESGATSKALQAWDSVELMGTPQQQLISRSIRHILRMPTADVINLTDSEKYQFCRYRIGVGDSVLFNRIVNSLDEPNYKAQVLLDLSRKYLDAGNITAAIHYYNRIAGLQLTDQRLYSDFRHFELLLLSTRREVRLLATQINKGLEFDASRRLEKIYYTALISESNGDIASARKLYKILGRYNPFFVDGILSASQFFQKTNPSAFDAYTILSEAVHVNTTSLRLWTAYRDEALRMGFDEYAAGAEETIAELSGN
jgi:hypothetical protein